MGDGPIYNFYRPYHLSPIETPLTVAGAVLFNDAAVAPNGAPVVDMVTLAKFDLKAGTKLDGVGGFHQYGVMENSQVAPGARTCCRWVSPTVALLSRRPPGHGP